MRPALYIRKLAESRHPGAVKVHDCGNGHVQIHGPLLVNYYPDSKRRTAYVEGTKQGKHHVSPEEALAMAFKAPPITERRERRHKQRGAKRRLLRKTPSQGEKFMCMWCREFFLPIDLTVEHRVPLARGGLDNDNNKGLACAPCNQGRGHDMPELARG